MREVTAAR